MARLQSKWPRYAAIFATWLMAVPAAAQNSSIVGVWRSQVEGTPSGGSPGVSASDVQTLYFDPNGQYRREIVTEGGNGVFGAAGKIIDSGLYNFTPPATLQYSRQNWLVCTFSGCIPGSGPPPDQGTLQFQMNGQGQATFIGLTWTKIQ